MKRAALMVLAGLLIAGAAWWWRDTSHEPLGSLEPSNAPAQRAPREPREGPAVELPRSMSAESTRAAPAQAERVRIQLRWWPPSAGAALELPSGQLELVALDNEPERPRRVTLELVEGAAELPGHFGSGSRWAVAGAALHEPAAHLLDTRFVMPEAPATISLRVTSEPFVVALDPLDLAPIEFVRLGSARTPPPGSKPIWSYPGPWVDEPEPALVRAPVPVRELAGTERPMIGAPGRAWMPIPDQVAERGGVVLLDRAADVQLEFELDALPESPGQLEFTLARAGAYVGEYDYACAHPLTPESARSIFLELTGIAPGDYLVRAITRVDYPRQPDGFLTKGEAPLSVRLDRPSSAALRLRTGEAEIQVDGRLILPDVELRERLQHLRFERQGAVLSQINARGGHLRKDEQLEWELPDTLRWSALPMAPGKYLAVLAPLGIYAPFEVSAAPEHQSVTIELPVLVDRLVTVLDPLTGAPADLAGASIEASLDPDELTAPFVRLVDRPKGPPPNPVRVRAPRGALVRMHAHTAAGGQGRWELGPQTTGPVTVTLQAPRSALRAWTVSLGEPVGMSVEWWTQHVQAQAEDGTVLPLIARPSLSGLGRGGGGRRSYWGTTSAPWPGRHTATLELPAAATRLVLTGLGPGTPPRAVALPADWVGTDIELELGVSPRSSLSDPNDPWAELPAAQVGDVRIEPPR